MGNKTPSSMDASPPMSWDASMSQSQFMERDTVLVLDNDDNVIGSASKKESHVFSPDTPRGVLHRAFSVFLFEEEEDGEGGGGGGGPRLLLQKRASTKITFPNVWTNTCCSHPLHGMIPDEVDGPGDVSSGMAHGVKNAAIRKLGHELGVRADELKVSVFTSISFLGRSEDAAGAAAAVASTDGEGGGGGGHAIVLFFVFY